MLPPRVVPAAIVVLALFVTGLQAATPPAQAVQVGAVFVHGQLPGRYLSVLGGVAPVLLDATPNGLARVELQLGLGAGACRLFLITGADGASQQPPWVTPAIEVCLAASGVEGKALDSWLTDGLGPAPTLSFLLEPDPLAPAKRWLNISEVTATLLIRDCGSATTHRVYGSLTIPAAALAVERLTLQTNEPWLRLDARKVFISHVDQKTWTEVVRGCGNDKAPMPDSPLDGFSERLVARSDRLTLSGAAAYLSLEQARGALADLVGQDVINRVMALTVVAPLDESQTALNHTQPSDAIRAAKQASAQAGQAIPKDSLSAVAAPLEAAVADFTLSVFGDGQVLAAPECVRSGRCSALTLFVDATARPATADGSAPRPFPTIRAALEAGARSGSCALNVVVRPGRYSDALTITRHTRILGTESGRPQITGPIVQTGPYDLTLSHVDLVKTSDTALRVTNPCAVTALHSIFVSAATGNGIVQEGGALTAETLIVLGTQSRDDGRGGRAVVLTNGVRAFMRNVSLNDNAGGALLVDGPETKLFLRSAGIRGNHLSPALARRDVILEEILAEGGAVQVRNHALLLGEWVYLSGNENVGLQVIQAQAHIQGSTIDGTVLPPIPGGVPLTFPSGVNLFAYAGTVNATHFTFSNAAVIGARFSVNRGRLSQGLITNSPIGAAVFMSPMPIECLLDSVSFIDDGINLDTDVFLLPPPVAIPDPDGPPGGPPPPPPCPSLPFVCDWCSF